MFSEKTKQMMQRSLLRTLLLLVLTTGGFLASQWLVIAATKYGFDLPKQFPELLLIMTALAQYTWIEVSVFWVRLILQPNTDVQAAANAALKDPMASSVVYFTHSATWLARVIIILYMAQLLS